ncbi:MAG: type III-A CRISPR-associated RAMP protein Csm5 [Bryobacterales bacterium]|nr:type III-A CRISPR-associated RAMP protein Csm5 [Bryobacteraceae bacterium]MDW8130341.1 type III-A CRISPR-associated RAMP protein Csm5 [Bryobacterales bacterium]
MEERVFRLTPLTPVHIGTGETIGPEEYLIQVGQFVRINTHKILMDWPLASRQRFEQFIFNNRIEEARRMLHDAASKAEFQLYRAAIGEPSRRELERVAPSKRSGEVHTHVRNLHTGRVVVPGSAIKGAMRTAVLSVLAHHEGQKLAALVRSALNRDRNTAWMTLEEQALSYEREHTEDDPLRMLRVSDGELPTGAVRVDRVQVVGRGGQSGQAQKIQLHLERLLSRADGSPPYSCEVRIILDGRVRVRRPLDWSFLVASCNYFFWHRYQEEVIAFPILAEREWVPASWPQGSILLRIGRFSHFESLSVDGLRSGWNIQRKCPIEGMGSSRSLCMITDQILAPFGWVLLEPV